MRTFPKAAVLFGFAAIICFSRCGPVVSSLQKGNPGFGNLGPRGPLDESADEVARTAVVEPASAARAQATKLAAGSLFIDGAAQLQAFKDHGEIDITPQSGEIDVDQLEIIVRVDLTASRIDELNISKLPLKLVERDGQVLLVVAQQSAADGATVRKYATSIELKSTATAVNASNGGRRIYARKR